MSQPDLVFERYNIAPSQNIPIVRLTGGVRELVEARWGLVPFWSKGIDTKYSMINARVETIAKKPAYRKPFKTQRCLIPASGYYEWHIENGHKQPYHIQLDDHSLYAFAGLWDYWNNNEQSITSATIITSEADPYLAWLHPRIPVILKPDQYTDWLNTDSKSEDMLDLLTNNSEINYQYDPVSTYVNSPKHQGEECIKPMMQ